MRLATIRTPSGTRAVRIEGETGIELPVADVGALLANPDWPRVAAAGDGPRHPMATVDLAPVVPPPPKIICVGLNYRSHIEETGRALPTHPTLFAKFTSALIGARDDLVLPAEAQSPDWEVELGVVVGRRTRRASHDEARAAIAGYTVVNDVTMRDWQRRTLQWLQGKTFEGTTPVGPVLVTPDEVDDARSLALGTEVDGVVMQEGNTADLLFDPAAIVAYNSTFTTVEPGDVIATGTPSGVGEGRTPPVFLQPGQVLRTWVEGIGECLNRCVPELGAESVPTL
jgi:acylpyruvate hydrolase